jgi:3-carboxy-cis,cis-muconate cycloisomerase
MQTEVGEVAEPFAPGRGASSTMPQKRNPVSSVYLHACAAVVRQHVVLLLEAMAADHERATGPWHIEWIVLPEAFVLTAGALAHARTIVDGLQVDAGRMRDNLELTHGLIVAEAVMMGLAPHLGRERAHDLVYELCRMAIERQRPLLDLLAETSEVTAHLDRERLAALCEPANYLGFAGEMVDRVLAARGGR